MSKQKFISDLCDIRNSKLEATLASIYCLDINAPQIGTFITFGLQFPEISFILHFPDAVAESSHKLLIFLVEMVFENKIK